jgi:hypothetical protein
MNGDDRPGLSVVIAATDSAPAVDRLLRSLAGRDAGRVEVIVVGEAGVVGHDGRPEHPATVNPRFSPTPHPNPPPQGGRGPFPLAPPLWGRAGVGGRDGPELKTNDDQPRRIVAPPGSGVPRLRRLGLEAASGRVVAFTEDSCVAAPGWLDAWISAFDDPSIAAASGVVEHDPRASAVDRAVVFCEYAPFLPPTPAGPPARLAGNNFAVDRGVALRLAGDELHETALLAAILREGRPVRTADRAIVRHVRRFGWREAFGDRLRFGFEFGRLRSRGLSPIARLAGWVAGPAIFAVQAGRLGLTILRGRRHLVSFLKSLPITLAMLAAWSLGEWAGWCLGPINNPHQHRFTSIPPPSPSGRGPG